LASVFFIIGCSSFSTIVNKTKNAGSAIINKTKDTGLKLMPSESRLKKKIGFIYFDNISEVKDESLIKHLWVCVKEDLTSKCPEALIVLPGETDRARFLSDPPVDSSGKIDNIALIKKGREIGLNAILLSTITNIIPNEKESGFIWFKKKHNFLELRIKTEIFDTHTAAKYLFKTITGKIEIDPSTADDILKKDLLSIPEFEAAMGKASKEIAKNACDAIKSQPWKGYIISAKGNKAVISSGADVGIEAGDVFKVYNIYGKVEGTEGSQYFIPGQETDELKITSVASHNATGVTVSGKQITLESIVQFKEK
jgi:hypothetical protein